MNKEGNFRMLRDNFYIKIFGFMLNKEVRCFMVE